MHQAYLVKFIDMRLAYVYSPEASFGTVRPCARRNGLMENAKYDMTSTIGERRMFVSALQGSVFGALRMQEMVQGLMDQQAR